MESLLARNESVPARSVNHLSESRACIFIRFGLSFDEKCSNGLDFTCYMYRLNPESVRLETSALILDPTENNGFDNFWCPQPSTSGRERAEGYG